MKKILLMLVLLVVPIVYAEDDMYVYDGFWTPNDIHAYIDINAGRDAYVTIDGADYQSSMQAMQQQISDSGISMNHVFYKIYGLWMKKNPYNNKWQKVSMDEIEELNAWRTRAVFEAQFIPMPELTKYIDQLSFELMFLQGLVDPAKLCDSKMKVGKQYNLPYIYCGNETIHNVKGTDKWVTFTQLEDEEPEDEEYIPAVVRRKDSFMAAIARICNRTKKKHYCEGYEYLANGG